MPVSLSIGDFIAVTKLICDIISTLRRSASAHTECQELQRELSELQKALHDIEYLEVHDSHQPAAKAIKCAALSCQHVLEEFNTKLSKYKKPFGRDSASGRFKAVGKKLQWEFRMTDEVTKLRVYIAAHVGSLNMRLLTLGL